MDTLSNTIAPYIPRPKGRGFTALLSVTSTSFTRTSCLEPSLYFLRNTPASPEHNPSIPHNHSR